jgi:hypothetical protein
MPTWSKGTAGVQIRCTVFAPGALQKSIVGERLKASTGAQSRTQSLMVLQPQGL